MPEYVFYNSDTLEVYFSGEAETREQARDIWCQKCGHDDPATFEAYVKDRIGPANIKTAIEIGSKGERDKIHDKILAVFRDDGIVVSCFFFYLKNNRKITVFTSLDANLIKKHCIDTGYWDIVRTIGLISIHDVPDNVMEYATPLIEK
jgi:hypothetical protein